MIFIRSVLFNIAFYVYTALISLMGLPALWMGRGALEIVGKSWAIGCLWLLRWICGIHYELRGQEYLAQQPAIFASKHQSAWDTLIFWALLKNPVYVLKKELLYLPLFGWYLAALKSIVVDRKAGSSALKKMLQQTRTALEEKRSVVLFPEGTRRSVNAEPLYQPGVAAIYAQVDAPIIPVALNSGQHWGPACFFQAARHNCYSVSTAYGARAKRPPIYECVRESNRNGKPSALCGRQPLAIASLARRANAVWDVRNAT